MGTNIKIPSTVTFRGKKLSVTSIGTDIFSGRKYIVSVKIPNSVTNIGQGAFSGCTSLNSIEIPNSVTNIGQKAFFGCTGLRSVTVSDSVTSINQSTFSECTSLNSISIGNSVTSIGKNAFSGCTCLWSIYFWGNSLTVIGENAFNGCISLNSIRIPDSVTSIGDSAFYGCTSLNSVVIGSSVTSIGGYAFAKCKNLKILTLPDSVTSITSTAIVDSGIIEFHIGKGIKVLPRIHMNYQYPSNAKYGTDYRLFWGESNERNVQYKWDSNLQYNIENSDKKFQYQCDSLYKVVIENSDEELGGQDDDFERLSSLREIYIGRNLKFKITNKYVKQIEYGDLCTQEASVAECESLEKIVYGRGIRCINICNIPIDKLAEIYLKSETPPTVCGAFSHNAYLNIKVYVPKESLATYKLADVWKDFWYIEDYVYMDSVNRKRPQRKQSKSSKK